MLSGISIEKILGRTRYEREDKIYEDDLEHSGYEQVYISQMTVGID